MPPEFPERREFECGRDGRKTAVPQIIGNPQTSAKLYDRLWFVYSLKLVEFSTSFFNIWDSTCLINRKVDGLTDALAKRSHAGHRLSRTKGGGRRQDSVEAAVSGRLG